MGYERVGATTSTNYYLHHELYVEKKKPNQRTVKYTHGNMWFLLL